jgi:hypothetical protein
MTMPRDKMPLMSAAEVTLTAEEKRLAVTELRNKDVLGHKLNFMSSEVSARYALSNYLVDPCCHRWTVAVWIVALVQLFIKKLRAKASARKGPQTNTYPEPAVLKLKVSNWERKSRIPLMKPHEATAVTITAADMADAADYFFRKAIKEVKRFTKHCISEREGILYFSGCLLDTGRVKAMEEVMFDLSPVSFCKPIVDRHSPVAYAIMLEMHRTEVNHLNSITT